jgi:hypothetical protein
MVWSFMVLSPCVRPRAFLGGSGPHFHEHPLNSQNSNENRVYDKNGMVVHGPLPVCSQSWRRAFAVAVVTSSFLPEKSRRPTKRAADLARTKCSSSRFGRGSACPDYQQHRRGHAHRSFSTPGEADSRSRLRWHSILSWHFIKSANNG